MGSTLETARLIALLRATKRPWSHYSEAIEEQGSALAPLEEEQGLLAGELAEAELSILERWAQRGYSALTVLDPGYPDNLRAVHDRPPLIFIAGTYQQPRDWRSIAVVGSRDATPEGLDAARALASHLSRSSYTVVSGLARGIDAAAHRETLSRGGRTVAVIGTGLDRCYPPEHAALQAEIAGSGAVISQFWPESGPTRASFPMRNAVMSGLSLGTVIVEATRTSGSRIQARRALLHGRPVFVRRQLLSQPWARELAKRPGAHVYETPHEVTDAIERLTSSDPLTA
jgi:DNA processing protein